MYTHDVYMKVVLQFCIFSHVTEFLVSNFDLIIIRDMVYTAYKKGCKMDMHERGCPTNVVGLDSGVIEAVYLLVNRK